MKAGVLACERCLIDMSALCNCCAAYKRGRVLPCNVQAKADNIVQGHIPYPLVTSKDANVPWC